jgi:MFS family permease
MPKPISPTAARVAVGTIFFVNGFGFATWVSRIPAVRDALGLSDGQLGTALFAIAAGALVAFPLTGRATATKGARAIALASGLAYCLALAIPPHTTSLLSLSAALFVFGFTSGAMDVAMNAVAVEVEELAGKPIMSSLHGLWSAGGLAGALMGGLFAKLGFSPQAHLGLASIALVIVVAAVRALLPPSKIHPTAESTPHFALPEANMIGLGIIICCSFLIEGAMADWSAVLLRDAMATTEAVAALGYAAFSLAMMGLRFAGDRIAERWDASTLLQVMNAIGAVAFGAALWLQHVGFTMIAFALMGFGVATVAPLVLRAAAHRSHHGPGHGIAAMSTVGYGGFLIGPPLVGWLADLTSLPIALSLLVVLALAIVAFAGQLRERSDEVTQ